MAQQTQLQGQRPRTCTFLPPDRGTSSGGLITLPAVGFGVRGKAEEVPAATVQIHSGYVVLRVEQIQGTGPTHVDLPATEEVLWHLCPVYRVSLNY